MTKPQDADPTARRKDAHLDLCLRPEVEPEGARTLLDEVHLIHNALPELAEPELDLSARFLGKPLRAPLLILGMTGGTPRGGELNRALAAIAERLGVAFGLGSQRAMLERPSARDTYSVREVAPTVPVLGNIGIAQAIALGPGRVRDLMESIGADGLALHLNAAQEMAQPEGDRDFRGALEAIARLADVLGPKLVVKETGCGISPATCARLVERGVSCVDLSGAGGTSWVSVEILRGGRPGAQPFATWGIPTAAAVLGARRRVGGAPTLIASGGIRDGLQAAKALALGADLVGVALPALRAHEDGGSEGAQASLMAIVDGLRMALLLTGCRTPAQLRDVPRVMGPDLARWLEVL
ncbi:MAG: type 2 isopentenyl-diphosphate Delta-isomerase [Deltaproteobacteria bacterium]|nr:type 2 isopentenyl-diphosphate Delta-isomerase [Deltaproteobacteria bacterium]